MKLLINGLSLRSPRTGVGNYVFHLGQALTRISPQDQIRFFYGGWIGGLHDQQSGRISGLTSQGRRHPWLYALRHGMSQGALALARRVQPWDLYHETGLVPLGGGRPTVMTLFDLSLVKFPETHPPARVRFFNDQFPARAAAVEHFLTISHRVKQEMIATFGIPEQRISVTSLGVDQAYRPLNHEQAQGVLGRLGLKYGDYFLFVGTQEPRKNLATGLAAYQMLPAAIRRRLPWLQVGGAGWGMDQGASPPSGVIRAGYLPQADLPALYSGARALIFPSLYEGFGLPVLEAMSCGCPVITSQDSAMAEVTGPAALHVNPLDPAGLAAAMERISADPALGERLRQAGLARAREFSWERCAEQTLALYRRIVGRNRG